VAKDKTGNEIPTPEPSSNGHAAKMKLPLYRIMRKKKKTASDQSGWELMTITRAEDENDAFQIGRQMYEAEHGQPIKVELVS